MFYVRFFFHEAADKFRISAWPIIQECVHLDWLVLTKRPKQIESSLPFNWNGGYSNVWMGVTAGCKESLHRVETLLETPAKLRWISVEPLLEKIDLRPYLGSIDWVVTGCEQASKAKRRRMDLDWIRDIDEQCRQFGVPHYFKQYYNEQDTGVPITDGMLDGIVRQDFPVSPAAAEYPTLLEILKN